MSHPPECGARKLGKGGREEEERRDEEGRGRGEERKRQKEQRIVLQRDSSSQGPSRTVAAYGRSPSEETGLLFIATST